MQTDKQPRPTNPYAIALIALLLLNVAVSALALHRASKAELVAQRAANARVALRGNTLADLAAFERSPSERTLDAMEGDIIGEQSQLPIVERLAAILAYNDLPDRLENGLIVDLAKYDPVNTVRWLHQLNVVARLSPSKDGPAIVRRTAKACWLMLGLRPNYGTAGIDLTRMDLRTDSAFVGQQMNLSYVDFRDAVLSPGTWRGSNLSNSAFDNVQLAGELRCVDCIFGGRLVGGTALFQGGHWLTSAPGKPPTRVD
jgi:hypothetical protein